MMSQPPTAKSRIPSDTLPPADPLAENPIAHVPYNAAGDFLLHFYAAVHRLLHHARRLAEHGNDNSIFLKYPFLTHYGNEIMANAPAEAAPDWWEKAIADWRIAQRPPAGTRVPHLPLLTLTQGAGGGIPFRARVALLLIGLVEEDSRFGTVITDLQAPLAHRRPTLEFVTNVMADDPSDLGHNAVDASAPCRALLAAVLIEPLNRDAPRSEWALRVPPILWDAIRGNADADAIAWCRLHDRDKFSDPDRLIGPSDFLEQLQRVPALLASDQANAVILRGMPGSDRLQILGSVARAMSRNIIEVFAPPAAPHARDGKETVDSPRSPELLGPLCGLTGAMPVFRFDLAPGETSAIRTLAAYTGPVGVILGLEGGVTGRCVERSVTLTVTNPDSRQRLRLWKAALGDRSSEGLEVIADRFHLPAGYIREAAILASARSALEGRQSINANDVRHACRALNRQALDTLATRLETRGGWNDLVLTGNATDKLRELQRRCFHRERLLTHLGAAFGPAASGNQGVRALLTGPSGTGKTLAARILAAELGMDLYRVDLAAVINKYIGETEKNLHRVLAIAESHDVILLLDEGDSVLGSRTNIKSSNDRYANLETNYLLQRLETYQGIVLVTTNLGENIDQAFQRRMDVVVNFVAPQATERLRIWQIHLPDTHAVPPQYLHEGALRCVLTGGQIRNAAQHAALVALDENCSSITAGHLTKAILSEYRKAGAVCPLQPGPEGNVSHQSAGPQEAFRASFK